MPRIKAIIEAIYSKRDRSGNCYWAMRYTDVASGREVHGSISGGESNIYAVGREMGYESGEVHFSVQELGIRDFNRLTKEWPYIGCAPVDLVKYILATLRIIALGENPVVAVRQMNCGECLVHHVEVVALQADGTCDCCASGHETFERGPLPRRIPGRIIRQR